LVLRDESEEDLKSCLLIKLGPRSPDQDQNLDWYLLEGPSRTGELDFTEPMRQRFLCFFLLSLLPDRALAEATGSLASMWDFYREVPMLTPALSAPQSIPITMGAEYVRPEFHASED
jgi:hypothetical protein